MAKQAKKSKQPATETNAEPNILILWGDDIGWWNISYNSRGQMGYRTPNIDRIANEGMLLRLLWSAELHGGRAAFITGQNPIRTGLTKVEGPGMDLGLRPKIRRLRTAQTPWVYYRDNLERTPRRLGMSSFLPGTVSTSSLVISIT